MDRVGAFDGKRAAGIIVPEEDLERAGLGASRLKDA